MENMAEYLERDPGIKVYDAFYIRHLRKLSCFSYAVHREMQMFKDSASIDWNSFHPTTCYIKIYRNSLYASARISRFRLRKILYQQFLEKSFSKSSTRIISISSSQIRQCRESRRRHRKVSPSIPNPDQKKPAVKSVNHGRGSYSNCASYLRRNQLFPGIVIFLGCPPRNLRRGQRRRRKIPLSCIPTSTISRRRTREERRGEGNTRARFHTGCP